MASVAKVVAVIATQLFLLDTVADTHLGTDNANNRATPANVGWTSRALGTARGSGVVATDAVATITSTGATDNVVVTKTSALEWISPPVAADVTISGTLTGNVWAAESSMTANVAAGFIIDVIRANATVTRNSNTLTPIIDGVILGSLSGVEIATTTRAVTNFTTASYTPVTINRGDRIRIRVIGTPVGTMASGFTFNASYNGATAAADGDTYVTFTENITFETPVPSVVNFPTLSSTADIYGSGGIFEQVAQSFVSPATGTLNEVRLQLYAAGTVTDNLIIEIQTDSGGVPSGSVVGTVATIAASSISISGTLSVNACSISVTASTTYWIVARRSGARDTTNRIAWAYGTGNTYASGVPASRTSGSWGAGTNDQMFSVQVQDVRSTLYLTDTASDVATASVDREAWTSRGAGVQTDVTNTSAGWVTPIQVTDTAGGTVVDWFTKQLTAFTLGGMAVANIRALESNALGNASLRCQIARVASDGTSPTVWADWAIAPTTTDNGELGTTEAARTCNVSGDDLAFTDGQRIRIRLYVDDMSSAAMGASQTVTTYYAGTSAAASGDTYITLPQSVTEYVAGGGAPGPATMRRQRRANRYLTVR